MENRYKDIDLENLKNQFAVSEQPTKGLKFDEGKPPMDLLPYESLAAVAQVLAFGATKYSRGNWANGINYSRLLSASMRHIYQYNNGEDLDPETGLSHIAHGICDLLFLLHFIQTEQTKLDDRYVKEQS